MKYNQAKIEKINLQLFAEPGGEPGSDPAPNPEPTSDIEPEPKQTFTKEEAEAIASKRLAEEQAKWEKEYQEKLEKEKAEAEKLAKMSADQRAKAEFEKEQQKFAAEREAFEKERLNLEVRKQLSDNGLDQDFATFLIGVDAESSLKNINQFKEAFNKAVESEVLKKLAGEPPKAGGGASNDNLTYSQMMAKQNK
ncbi:hypothetical protein EUAN_12450 [Andreesenia angusta]|uniref:DUF4355 domain-containing protein n=1 Tax=Andreesenia angusta TaxID=39480 RepID=A0A1S1V6A9_9FIRM|nr:DUF4355 domain-containing protein [Andreesenia angusta]OHW62176.1 hypothetical protein EUAN_12450 [Andreesenia angusta]